jgi:hypothetical protein
LLAHLAAEQKLLLLLLQPHLRSVLLHPAQGRLSRYFLEQLLHLMAAA